MIVHMDKQIIFNQLSLYGINEAEAELYLYLREHGPQTPLQLSRTLHIDRSKVYRVVEHLLQVGLLEQSHAAWGKKLQAASPSVISRIIAEKEDEIATQKAALPELIQELSHVSNYTKREFEVRHYRGQEGLRQMLWNQLASRGEIVAFSYKNKNDITGKAYADKVRQEQLNRKIMLYEVENETDQGDYWYTDIEGWEEYYQSRHIDPQLLQIQQYIAVFNDTVAIMNWIDDEEVGLEITNAPYADMQRQLFWQFWAQANAPH